MKQIDRFRQLRNRVWSLLMKNGYKFSEEDKRLLDDILVALDEMIENDPGDESCPGQDLKILNLILRLLKFFGIEELKDLV